MELQNLMDDQLARLQLLYQLWVDDKDNEKIRSEFEQALSELNDLELTTKWLWQKECLETELDNFYSPSNLDDIPF